MITITKELLFITQNKCEFSDIIRDYLDAKGVDYKERNFDMYPMVVIENVVTSTPVLILKVNDVEVERVSGSNIKEVDEIIKSFNNKDKH